MRTITGYLAQAVWPDGSVGQAVLCREPRACFLRWPSPVGPESSLCAPSSKCGWSAVFSRSTRGPVPPAPLVPSQARTRLRARQSRSGTGPALGAQLWVQDYTRPFEDNWLYRNFVFASTLIFEPYAGSSGHRHHGWDDVNGDLIHGQSALTVPDAHQRVFPAGPVGRGHHLDHPPPIRARLTCTRRRTSSRCKTASRPVTVDVRSGRSTDTVTVPWSDTRPVRQLGALGRHGRGPVQSKEHTPPQDIIQPNNCQGHEHQHRRLPVEPNKHDIR